MIATVHGNQTDPMYALAVLFRMEIEKNIKYEKGFFKTFFSDLAHIKACGWFYTGHFDVHAFISHEQNDHK